MMYTYKSLETLWESECNKAVRKNNLTTILLMIPPSRKKKFNDTLNIGKEYWINKLRLKIISGSRLQRYWRFYSSHPEYKLSQRLIIARLKE